MAHLYFSGKRKDLQLLLVETEVLQENSPTVSLPCRFSEILVKKCISAILRACHCESLLPLTAELVGRKVVAVARTS